jgi:hypothetical protein
LETAIVSILCIALMVVGGMTMSRGFINSAESASNGLKQLSLSDQEISHTSLKVVNGRFLPDDTLEVVLENSGQTKLSDFGKWDFIAQYRDAAGQDNVKWLPYADDDIGTNEWTVTGIYIKASTEVDEQFDLNILNPSEEIVLKASVDPPVGDANAVQVIISAPNGVQVSTIFIRE